jgi:hypothetical protein
MSLLAFCFKYTLIDSNEKQVDKVWSKIKYKEREFYRKISSWPEALLIKAERDAPLNFFCFFELLE